MKNSEIKREGMLTGLRVAFSAVSIAGPFFGSLMADHGADVLWIESPMGSFDRQGGQGSPGFIDSDRKNMRSIVMNIPSETGKKAFLKLLKNVDIFLEASKGGQYERWGLTDDVLWEANPKLIIIHVSGFGMFGDPNYTKRASYDPIAQSFGGLVYANTLPGMPPHPAGALVGDYYTGLFAFGSGLAAYINMLKTGKGESLDVNQFEAIVRCLYPGLRDWNVPADDPRANLRYKQGTISETAGSDMYECGDGNYAMLLLGLGANIIRKVLKMLGEDPTDTEKWPERYMYWDWEPEGKAYDALIRKWCMQHTAQEVEDILSNMGCPACCVLTFDQQLTHPHFLARETLVTVDSKFMGIPQVIPNIYPRAKNAPGKIWRVAPLYGEDTNDVLSDYGFSDEEIAELAESKTIIQG